MSDYRISSNGYTYRIETLSTRYRMIKRETWFSDAEFEEEFFWDTATDIFNCTYYPEVSTKEEAREQIKQHAYDEKKSAATWEMVEEYSAKAVERMIEDYEPKEEQ